MQVTGTWPPEIDLRISTDQSGVQTSVRCRQQFRHAAMDDIQQPGLQRRCLAHLCVGLGNRQHHLLYRRQSGLAGADAAGWNLHHQSDVPVPANQRQLYRQRRPDPNALNGYEAIVSNVTVYASGAGAGNPVSGSSSGGTVSGSGGGTVSSSSEYSFVRFQLRLCSMRHEQQCNDNRIKHRRHDRRFIWRNSVRRFGRHSIWQLGFFERNGCRWLKRQFRRYEQQRIVLGQRHYDDQRHLRASQ